MSRRRHNLEGLSDYFEEFLCQSPLSIEAEREVAAKCKAGDLAARDVLILTNMRMVVYMASRFKPNNSETLRDLVQAGAVGLIEAVDLFDLDRKVRLSSFAVARVWWRMKQVTDEDYNLPSSLDSLSADGANPIDTHEMAPIEVAEQRETFDRLVAMLWQLPDLHRRALEARYGLDGFGKMRTLDEVALMFGFSIARAGALCDEAISKLKETQR